MDDKKKNAFVASWLRGWKVIGRLFLLIALLLFLQQLMIPFGGALLIAICGENKVLYYPAGILIALVFIPFIFDIFNQSTGLLNSSGKCFENKKGALEKTPDN